MSLLEAAAENNSAKPEIYISDANYTVLVEILQKESGLALKGDKKYLLESRLLPIVRKHNIPTIDELANKLKSSVGGLLLKEVIEEMATYETFFFRDMKPFTHLKKMMPAMIEKCASKRSLRVWSAASSSGQEIYTLAMILDDFKAKLQGWRIELVATDISDKILAKAKDGVYSQFEVQRGLPTNYLISHFEQKGTDWHIKEELKKNISFKQNNLLKFNHSLGKFDIIFCRNVLFYFDREAKIQVFKDMHKYIQPHGLMYLGGAESVMGYTELFKPMEGISGGFEVKDGDSIIKPLETR